MTFAEALPYVLIGPGISNSEIEVATMCGYLCYRTKPQSRWRPYCPTVEDICNENWRKIGPVTLEQPLVDLKDWYEIDPNVTVEIDCERLDRSKRDSWAKAKDIVLD